MDDVRSVEVSTRRRGWFVVAAAAIVLLGLGLRQSVFRYDFTADDYAQVAMMEHVYPVARAPLSLFTFSDGSAAEARALVHSGFYPWFAHERLELSMMRPLSCALMWLDHALFGRAALGYHLHSALWWIALLAAFAAFVRRWFAPRVALLALALFALDEAHTLVLGWVASRNAIVSTLLSLLALSAYVARRERGKASAGIAACALFALALAAGEYGLCMFCFFAGYELAAARDAPGARLRALLPIALLALSFLVLRNVLDYGAHGSDMYLDPLRAPGFFVRHACQRLPVLAGDLVLAIRADWYVFGFPLMPDLVRWGLADESWYVNPEPARAFLAGVGCVALALGLALALAALGRDRVDDARGAARRRHLRWIVLGALLSLIPLTPPFPSTRVLIAPLIGWSVLLAVLAERSLEMLAAGVRARLLTRWLALGALGFVAWHLWVDSGRAVGDSDMLAFMGKRSASIVRSAQLDDARLPSQRVVFLQSIDQGVTVYFSLVRQLYGLHAPEAHWTLSPAVLPYALSRTGPASLEIELKVGGLLTSTYESIFRTREAPVSVGQQFDCGGMRATVLGLRDGGVSRVGFTFDRPVDDPSLVFLISSARGLDRFVPPPVGGRVDIPFAALPAF